MPDLAKKDNGATAPATPEQIFNRFFSDPFGRWPSVRDMMNGFFQMPDFGAIPGQPAANVYEKDGSYLIECAVPGYSKDDITVEARDNEVTISGKYSHEANEDGKQYQRREMRQGSFSRTIDLAKEVDPNKVTASIENGMLKVTLTPVKPIESKKIPITSKS